LENIVREHYTYPTARFSFLYDVYYTPYEFGINIAHLYLVFVAWFVLLLMYTSVKGKVLVVRYAYTERYKYYNGISCYDYCSFVM
jgi:hypothetical protein